MDHFYHFFKNRTHWLAELLDPLIQRSESKSRTHDDFIVPNYLSTRITQILQQTAKFECNHGVFDWAFNKSSLRDAG